MLPGSMSSGSERRRNPFWLTELTATTDTDGHFTVTGVPKAGAKFDFLRESLTDLRNEKLRIGGVENAVKMEAGGAIRGRVVDADGKPVRSFCILVNIPHQRVPSEKVGGFFAGYCGIGLSYTSDDGVFVVTGVQAGYLHRISALAEGYGQADEDRVEAYPITNQPPAEALTLKLGPAHALRVHVTGADGKPVTRARVTLVNGDPELDRSFTWGYHDASWEDTVRGRSDRDGWAAFPALTFGEATVLVQVPGFARQRVGWGKGETELAVVLSTESRADIDVLDEAGQPARDVGVSLASSAGDQYPAMPQPEKPGHYRVDQVPGGDYTLNVFRSTGGGAPPEKLHLQPGPLISRTVRMPKPEPFPGIR